MKPFPDCGEMPLGIYPLVDRAEKLVTLFENGISTAQLRIKDLVGDALRAEIALAIKLAEQFKARLFINDAWQEAIALGAYGVHLGQEDCEALSEKDWLKLRSSDIRLGISTHTQSEMTFALSVKPSYIAIGPVFETQSKMLDYETTGLSCLSQWVTKVKIPVVAIGGIDDDKLSKVVETGVEGVAMIGAVQVSNTDPRIDVEKLKHLVTVFETSWQGKAHD
ncbi:thiamine phosphate synthase [Hydrogenovibrio kuenenii]|uniref:thiamine phosphate synthase n=1 Tax=Hydrogenovibrio kuenenii TaxID=63658 RepID=UPI0004676662|nr:thiamine phosphate synthase [Hydrogenovibrio kuenenii]